SGRDDTLSRELCARIEARRDSRASATGRDRFRPSKDRPPERLAKFRERRRQSNPPAAAAPVWRIMVRGGQRR
ncbi:hypothetical protein, partial [Ensifer aridi]|uniref:hypothetical protein n=1 Tax=Ensifer aridi TaxID=1708715 RepID=UPI001AECE0E5